MPYYLLNGLTQAAYTEKERTDFDEQGWADHLFQQPVKLYLSYGVQELVANLSDGDPMPDFIPVAMPETFEDYTQS